MRRNLFSVLILMLFLTVFHNAYGQPVLVSAMQSKNSNSGTASLVPGTGQLNYTIPLLSIESYGVVLPISISYQGSGNLVQSKSGWVGQGWQLSAGGSISRNVNGQPDDTDLFLNNDFILGYLNTGDTDFPYSDGEISPSGAKQKKDFSPDLFSINVPGLQSSRFSIKRRVGVGEILPLDAAEISNFEIVDFDYSIWDFNFGTDADRRINRFGIKNHQGLNFEFDNPERSVINAAVFNPNLSTALSYYSTWHLSSIKSEIGTELFNFQYYAEERTRESKGYHAHKTASLHSQMDGVLRTTTVSRVHAKHLQWIEFDNGKIEFEISDNLGEGLEDYYALKYIRQYNKQNDIVLEYEFIYSSVAGWDNQESRMFLNEIKKTLNSSQVESETISFSYNSTPLPFINSLQLDHWGYFNNSEVEGTGQIFPNTILPQVNNKVNGNYLVPFIANKFNERFRSRDPKMDYVKAGILEKVSFSSGKSTTFIYEPNEYSFREGTEAIHEVKNEKLEMLNVESNRQFYDEGGTYLVPRWNTIFVSVPFPQWVKIKFNKNNGCEEIAKFSGPNNFELDLPNGEYVWFFAVDGVNYSIKPHGDNALRCLSTNPNSPPSVTFHRKTHDAADSESFRIKGGGLRIKQIIEKHNNSTLEGTHFTRNFVYDKFDDSKKSSGIVVFEPNKTFIPSYAHLNGNTLPIYSQTSSDNLASVLRSNPVVYTNIEEYTCLSINGNCLGGLEGENGLGRTKKYFKYFPLSIKALSFPFLPDMENYSRRMQLEKEEYFGADGNPIADKNFNYEHLLGDVGITGAIEYVHQYNSQGIQWYRSDHYYNFPELNRLVSIDETIHDSGIDIQNTTSYEYHDNTELPNLINQTVEKIHGGIHLKTVKSFSGSFAFENADAVGQMAQALKILIEQGKLTMPVEEIIYLKEELEDNVYKPISRKIFLYKELLSGKVVLDKSIVRQIINPEIETHELIELTGTTDLSFEYLESENDIITTYTEYDEDNSLLTSKDTYGKSSSVIFNSNNLTTAIIRNSENSKSRYTSFEGGDFGGWNLSVADVDYHIIEASPTDFAITGNKYYNLGTVQNNDGNFNSGVSTNPFTAGKYILSYWSKGYVVPYLNNTGTINSTETLVEGDWTYVENIIEWSTDGNNDNFITIGGDGFIDELRCYEEEAAMETFGYYPDGKPMYKADSFGNVITYEYNSKSRLEWLLDRKRNAIEYHEYAEKNSGDINSYNKRTDFTVRKDGMSKIDVLNSDFVDDVKKSISYYDGFGRLKQVIDINSTSDNKARVQFMRHRFSDSKIPVGYLPYYTNLINDDYVLSAETQQSEYYENQIDENENTDFPYQKTVLEDGAGRRPIEIGGVGEELQPGDGHSTTLAYGWNDANDLILKWKYDETTKRAVVAPTQQYWAPGLLRKTIITSPDGHVSAVFTDPKGREVARRVVSKMFLDSQGNKSTGLIGQSSSEVEFKVVSYTVFDVFNRVRYDIPANAIESLNWSQINGYDVDYSDFSNFASFFDYDDRGRLKKRFSPGDQFVEYVYNVNDELILTQDAQQASQTIAKWSFIKYDSRGREVMNGILSSPSSQATHQNNADSYSVCFERKVSSGPEVYGYSNVSYPVISEAEVLNVYYFDDYDFTIPSSFDFESFGENTEESSLKRGLPTGSLSRVLNSNGVSGVMMVTVVYYDEDLRLIQSFSKNYKGGYVKINTYYNEYGQVEKTKQFNRLEETSDEHTLTKRYLYFPETGILQNTYCKIDDDPEILVSNRYYDEKGQLKDLKLHRPVGMSNYLQNIDYRYNAQGMLTHINNTALIDDGIHNLQDDDVFGQELTYFKPSPEYNDPGAQGSLTTNNPLANYVFTPQYGGQVSSMMWNAKAPEEDGTTLSRNVYVYDYDDFGQMVAGFYAADSPSMPGEFEENLGYYDEHVNYDLGGNIVKLNRSNLSLRNVNGSLMDELTYTYENDGAKLASVSDAGIGFMSNGFKHFVDGANTSQEYTYDAGGKILEDYNKDVRFQYNVLNLPRYIYQLSNTNYKMAFTYDAAGNKLQKHISRPQNDEPPYLAPFHLDYDIDYVGNFVYERGELKMIYHPEGVIRPTPENASNETEYVYDYFVKDYLGNVRAVITEEDAVITEKFLATMEAVHAVIEEENFDHINETRQPLPAGYPADGSMQLNESIAQLSAANGTEMGPSIVMPVKKGDKVSLSTQYFYEEDAPGTTYDNLGYLVNEILIALATSGAGVLNLSEAQLIDIASGDPTYTQAIMDLLDNSFDDSDIYKPHAYLVWMLYDVNMKLVPGSSGAIQVENPNALETLIKDVVNVSKDGYLHAYVSNGSSLDVPFDNFLVTRQRGQLRQINDYYPYGLAISGINGDYDEYLNKYQGKELQTGEFDSDLSTGLEMFDFHARYYDPQLGRWFTPDPAEQFSNPYLAMGNNPVMYVDPDGEWVHIVIGAAIGGVVNLAMNYHDGMSFSDGVNAFGIGALAGGVIAATGGAAAGAMGGGFVAAAGGAMVGTAIGIPIQSAGNNIAFDTPLISAEEYAKQVVISGAVAGLFNGVVSYASGNTFWNGTPRNTGSMSGSGSNQAGARGNGDLSGPKFSNKTTTTKTTMTEGGVTSEISFQKPEIQLVAGKPQRWDFSQGKWVPRIEVTEASIAKSLQSSTLQTLQGKVSLPMVQRYVRMLEQGQVPSPIKVSPNGVIIEGNHRYVAGRLYGVEPNQVPYPLSPSQADRAVPIQKTVIDYLDWDIFN